MKRLVPLMIAAVLLVALPAGAHKLPVSHAQSKAAAAYAAELKQTDRMRVREKSAYGCRTFRKKKNGKTHIHRVNCLVRAAGYNPEFDLDIAGWDGNVVCKGTANVTFPFSNSNKVDVEILHGYCR